MFRPRIPVNPTPTGIVTPLVVEPTAIEPHQHAPACACQHTPPPAPAPSGQAVRLTPTGLLAVVGGGAAVVLVVGTVLVSLLLAVAITAASVAVCALVVRSLLASETRKR
ncbi:SpdD-like protein [Streptomyces sp. 8N616]|uniref:SpdD-like protein n=1 Tax=Streptomyces sp. 8N616 TaxID=3457414 RepID=UPI003FD1AEC6